MEVIVFETETFKEIMKKIDQLDSKIEQIICFLQPENPKNKEVIKSKNTLTIKEILNLYFISRQTFFNYRKVVPLNGKRLGMYYHFKTEDVSMFFDKICKMKIANPELFVFKMIKQKS